MTIQMVVYTEIIYALTIILLEVPTGIIADRWSRQRMLVVSALFGCTEFAILLVASEFWHFAAVVFLAGISRSASSGAESALLYDSLLHQGKASSFETHVGRLNAFDILSAITAALCGSLLAGHYGLELNYWISLWSAALALLLTLLLREPPVAKQTSEDLEATHSIPMMEAVRVCFRFFRGNAGVSLVLMSGMITGAAMTYIEEFWQLYAKEQYVPVYLFGVLSGAIMLLQMPGNLLAHHLVRRFNPRMLILTVCVAFAVGFTLIATSHNVIGLAAMLMICLFTGVMEPITSGYLHHRIGSTMRATMDSFRSLGENVVTTAAGLGFGYFATRSDVFGGYGFIAVLCVTFLLWLIPTYRKIV